VHRNGSAAVQSDSIALDGRADCLLLNQIG
jgi:hypothetical protein